MDPRNVEILRTIWVNFEGARMAYATSMRLFDMGRNDVLIWAGEESVRRRDTRVIDDATEDVGIPELQDLQGQVRQGFETCRGALVEGYRKLFGEEGVSVLEHYFSARQSYGGSSSEGHDLLSIGPTIRAKDKSPREVYEEAQRALDRLTGERVTFVDKVEVVEGHG